MEKDHGHATCLENKEETARRTRLDPERAIREVIIAYRCTLCGSTWTETEDL
jgi:transposase-like protein